MAGTLKVGKTGRYGSRYGVGIRKRLLKVEEKQSQKYPCPKCGFSKLKRKSKGVYICRKCKVKFTGGAYVPATQTGIIVRKTVLQKKFMPYVAELVHATEVAKGEVKETEEINEKDEKPKKVKPKKKETEKKEPKKKEKPNKEKKNGK